MARYLGMNEGSLPALVHDILESNYGEWFDIERVATEVLTHRPHAQLGSIRRAVERLKSAGRVEWELRSRPHAGTGAWGSERTFLRVPWRHYWDEERESA